MDTVTGWIKLHRNIQDWEWYTDVNTCHLFIHILTKATHQDYSWRGIDIKAGQCICGRKELAIKTGLSEQQIRTSLNKLKSTKEVTIKSTTKYSIISITNWKSYQDSNQQPNQPATNEQPSSNHIQEHKNISTEEVKNIGTAFEAFVSLASSTNLSVPAKLTKSRASKLKARLNDCGGLDGWYAALDKLKNSGFCMGRKTSWKADFDFMLQEKSFFKLMEGSYDDAGNNKPTTKDKLASDTQLLLDRIRGSRAN